MKKVISATLAVIMLVSLFAVSVFAEEEFPSPGRDDYYTLTIGVKDNKGGTVTASSSTISKGDTVTITAKADDGYTFDGWTFTGEFDWVTGDANTASVVIRPHSDVTMISSFKGQGGADKDTGATSPTMGSNILAVSSVMAVVVLMSAAAVVYTGKKYYSSAR